MRRSLASIMEEMTNNAPRAIFTLGIAWGVVAFLLGLAGSFTLNSIHLIASLIVLIIGFLMVLPITILAIWKPKISAAFLTLSFLLLECAIYAIFGLSAVLRLALIEGIPYAALASGYLYVASVQDKARPKA